MASKERFYVDISTSCDEVTQSCHLVVTKLPNGETVKFIVDCGLFYAKKDDEEKALKINEKFHFLPETLKFCLVTHNHVDHTGRLPLLVKKGFQGKIYVTEDTKTLLPLALNDSYKVLKEKAKRSRSRQLYTESDVGNTSSKLSACVFEKVEYVHKNIKVTYFNNGHLVGAGMALVQISYPGFEDINILFMGDYNNKNIFLNLKELPDWVKNLNLTVITESTYGNMNSYEKRECFQENVLRCVHDGGSVVVPVFSLGRAQEILYEMKKLQSMKELNPSMPIRFDGKLGINYTRLFTSGKLHIKEEMIDFLPDNLTFVDKTTRAKILYSREPQIILTTSGMGSYGPAQFYIPEYVKRKGSMVHFTGYTAPNTFGGKLKNAKQGEVVTLNGLDVQKNATVEYTKEFSAHAKADELITFLKQFNNLKFVLVTHGETECREIFSQRVMREVKTKNVAILDSRYVFRINPYGLVKTINTKYLY